MGLINSKGHRKVNIVDGTSYTGVYSPDGEYNGVITDGSTSGLYHPCGAFNVTVVTDTDLYYGAYAPDGSIYVIETDTGYVVYKDNIDFNPPIPPEE